MRVSEQDHDDIFSDRSTERALDESRTILKTLIQESSRFILHHRAHNKDLNISEKDSIIIIMVTLLWTPFVQTNTNGDSILVRGHVFSTGEVVSRYKSDPKPISASIACQSSYNGSNTNLKSRVLPSRSHPHAKLSSWCRSRRPLEEQFKVLPDIQEVILSSQSSRSSEIELLEGLTSNLFVVYADGTIRTTMQGVLNGYAQDLIIKECQQSNLMLFSDAPILLQHGLDGQWKEVFVTSSIKLIVPVQRVYAPIFNDTVNRDNMEMVEIWKEPPLSNLTWDTRKWQVFLQQLLIKRGT